MMMGSDWPVSLLNGDFVGVWSAQMESIEHLSDSERDDICFKTADSFYQLGLA
jgi:L-fuconolactonase